MKKLSTHITESFQVNEEMKFTALTNHKNPGGSDYPKDTTEYKPADKKIKRVLLGKKFGSIEFTDASVFEWHKNHKNMKSNLDKILNDLSKVSAIDTINFEEFATKWKVDAY